MDMDKIDTISITMLIQSLEAFSLEAEKRKYNANSDLLEWYERGSIDTIGALIKALILYRERNQMINEKNGGDHDK